MTKILITGGTGLVGTHLSKLLTRKGYEIVMLSRRDGYKNGIKKFKWNPEMGEIDLKAFEGVDHIIHLAGSGIADKRWTTAYKAEIYNSRILSTRLLVNTINSFHLKPKTFISTSAIGIYGNEVSGNATENYPPATNYLANVCRDWEKETDLLLDQDIRKSIVRVGVVLAKESGFIPEVSKPIRFFAGAPLGNGKQLMSWIHIEDLCAIYLKCIEDPNIHGPINAVTPHPASNENITRLMSHKLNRPLWLPPIPAFVLNIIFGEIATTLVASQYIVPQKLTTSGFQFAFPTIETALDNLL